MITLLLLCLFGNADAVDQRLTVQPIDFQMEDVSETLVQQIRQIETDGIHIFVRTENNYILKLAPDGALVDVIRMPATGPDHFFRLGSFALAGDQMVAVNQGSQVFWFKDGGFVKQYPSAGFEAVYSFPFYNTNTIGFNGKAVVLPLTPGNQHLAAAYDGEGSLVARVGERPPIDSDYQDGFDTMNSTFWAWNGSQWIALYKFRAQMLVFDANFTLKKTIELTSPLVDEARASFYDQEPLSLREKKPVPFFFDLKAKGNRAWFLARGILHEVDLAKGQITHRYHFFGEGKDFEGVPTDQNLAFYMMAPLKDGRFILGHPALMWNHDLWAATSMHTPDTGQ